ncbi:MAG: PAS domain S-box protein, partial [Rubrivivax sp.]|nr:PAS domain S-box protein [Rubrivivax sp.]
LRLALQGADLGLWDLDVPSQRATVNARWAEMLGLPPDADASPQAWRSRVHPDDWPRVDAAQQAHLRGETERFEAIYRLRHADGHWVWVLDRGRVLERDADGAPLRMVGTHLDITERMQAQQVLRERERLLSAVADALPGPVSRADAEGRYLFANAAYETWFGLPAHEVVGRTQAEVLGAYYPAVEPHVRRALAGEVVRYEGAVRTRDGQSRHALVTLVPERGDDGRVVGHVTVVTDITERKRAEDALRRSEQRLRTLFDTLDVGVVVHAADTTVLDANPAASRILGLSLDQMRGKSAIGPQWTFLEADGTPMDPARYPVNQVAAGGQPLRQFVGGVRRPDRGQPLWVQVDAAPVTDARGRLEQIVVTFADISERKRSEQRLQAAQGDLQALLEAVPDLLFEIDLDGRIHRYHSREGALLYLPPEDFLGRTVAEVLPPSPAAVITTALREALDHGHSIGHQYELDLPRAGLRAYELSVARKPMARGELPRFVVLVRDVTERRQAERDRAALERQLREAQKMEAIGTLAGGIAHDFNNILAAILGNAALAREDAGADHPVQESLGQIHRAALRARELVQQILAFSRRQPPQMRCQPLRPVVEETLALLRATLPAGVRLVPRLADETIEVDADATQLQQVLINLCTNAWHALPPGGGSIEVGLDAAVADAAIAGGSEWPSGRCAHLWVRDNGCGMDAATRERIFEPFFTTKPLGQGTGLGLAVVHGIVQAHRGAVVVDSAPGHGSTFHLYFPLPERDPAAAASPASPPAPVRGHGEHVVYVDDDAVMVALVERLLQRAGYRTTVFPGALPALDFLRTRGADVALVITDQNMPDLAGLELCRELAALRPGLPVVLSSGFVSPALRAQAEALGVRALLHKEHTHEELAS